MKQRQGWNKSAPEPLKDPSSHRPSVLRGLVAGGLVVLLGCFAWWHLTSSDLESGIVAGKKENVPIKEVKPARHGKSDRCGLDKALLQLPTPSGRRIETRGAIPAPQKLEEMKAAITNRSPKTKSAFTNGVEQLIALATPPYPGATVPPLPPITDESVSEDLKAAMSHVIVAEEDDSAELLEKKAVVASAKIEYSELKESENCGFVEYVNALRDKANDDANFLAEAQKLAEELYHDAAISDKDYIKYREQLNADLRERGLPEIEKEEGEEDSVETQGKERNAASKVQENKENE